MEKAAPTQSLLRSEINTLKMKLEKIRSGIKQETKKKEKLRGEAISKLELIEIKEQANNSTILKYNAYVIEHYLIFLVT
jgi:hypothetical protein